MKDARIDEAARFIREDLRLKTLPVAVKFMGKGEAFPEKTKRPSETLGKRITICQAVTMARTYGWTVGLTRDDLVCVPAMLTFGFTDSSDPGKTLEGLFCEVQFAKDEKNAAREVSSMHRLANDPDRAVVLAPAQKGLFEPDAVAIYGNPAQLMRAVQALVYAKGDRVRGNFGGKVECAEYLLAPVASGAPRIAMPGMGDRIFSMTQDDEAVLGVPGKDVDALSDGLQNAGRAIGARYPVTFYQNFQPEFPPPYKRIAEDLDLF